MTVLLRQLAHAWSCETAFDRGTHSQSHMLNRLQGHVARSVAERSEVCTGKICYSDADLAVSFFITLYHGFPCLVKVVRMFAVS